MLKSIAMPSFFCFYIGAALPFWINIKNDSVAIMTAALIAALLTYYNSLVTAQNKSKDYREKVIENIVDKGREFIRKSDLIAVEALTYMPLKKESEEEIDNYSKDMERFDANINSIESSNKSDQVKKVEIGKKLEIVKQYQEAYKSSYNESRVRFNNKLSEFDKLKLNCFNAAEEFSDEVIMIKGFYGRSDNVEKAHEKIKKIVDIAKSVTEDAKKSKIYDVDKTLLNELSEHQTVLRELLRSIKTDCMLGVTLIDEENKNEKDLIFMLSIATFLIGIGFMVSNGFK